jgi:hypothetical protein
MERAMNTLPTTLLLLFFVAPPANDQLDKPKAIQEASRAWTLQSTSQVLTPSPDACLALGKQMIDRIDPVATLTVRAYCLCAHGNGRICTSDQNLKSKGLEPLVSQTPSPPMNPTVEAVGRARRTR